MTNKQIIIDGCDVSGCINFRPDVETTQVNYTNACSIGIWQRWYTNLEPSCIMSCSCKYNSNCYYKQLKAKEQECERLKEGLNLILTVQKNCKKCPHQKLDVDVLVCDLDCATAFKKIAKSTLRKCEE